MVRAEHERHHGVEAQEPTAIDREVTRLANELCRRMVRVLNSMMPPADQVNQDGEVD